MGDGEPGNLDDRGDAALLCDVAEVRHEAVRNVDRRRGEPSLRKRSSEGDAGDGVQMPADERPLRFFFHGFGSITSRRTAGPARRRSSPPAESPSVPDTNIRSPGSAPLRVSARPRSISPRAVTRDGDAASIRRSRRVSPASRVLNGLAASRTPG